MKPLKCYFVVSNRMPSFKIGQKLEIDDDISDYKLADFGTNFDEWLIDAGKIANDYSQGYRVDWFGKKEIIDRTKMKTMFLVLVSQRTNIVRAIIPINDIVKRGK